MMSFYLTKWVIPENASRCGTLLWCTILTFHLTKLFLYYVLILRLKMIFDTSIFKYSPIVLAGISIIATMVVIGLITYEGITFLNADWACHYYDDETGIHESFQILSTVYGGFDLIMNIVYLV